MDLNSEITYQIRIKETEIILFTRHLATLVRSGIPILEALSTLSEQTTSRNFKKIINELYGDVQNGQKLSNAMSKHPKVFDKLYVNLIDVSEQSGTLEENLAFISNQMVKKYNLKKKLQTASLYPTLILVVTLIIGGFISLFILPQLIVFFEAFDVELPVTTQILLYIANLLKNYGILIFTILIGLFLLIRILVKTRSIKPYWDSYILFVPILGNFLKNTQTAQFARSLGALLKSGVPILQSLNITSETQTNSKYSISLKKVQKSLENGITIANAIREQKINIYPPMVYKMIDIGERTGKLDESLLYIGDFYEEEIDNYLKNLTTILEPILLVIIGLIVGFIALAIVTPIYELSGSIRG